MQKSCLMTTLGHDPHTHGLFRIRRMVERAGFSCRVLPPGASDEDILLAMRQMNPTHVGLSYRLSPDVGVREFVRILNLFKEQALLQPASGTRKFAVAGLPDTMKIMVDMQSQLPCSVSTMPQDNDRLRGVARVLDFFDIFGSARESILAEMRAEFFPPSIGLLDELAKQVIAGDVYREEPPLPIPSLAARQSYIQRIKESDLPVIRTHFGVPAPTIRPTVEGIARLSEHRVIDEISIGSSDLSQRYFGYPEEFAQRKNDGGVPYKTVSDLVDMVEAAKRGNYPSLKPYAHVVELVKFVETCLKVGMLVGAHQAVPLYWFNELDGRGPMAMRESIDEHIAAVKELARRNIPVEMNDPNQWSSRWAHDTIISTDYALITAVMAEAGVQDIVLQMQFNKPRETSDFGDLAKMTAGLELASEITQGMPNVRVWRETRTGIDSLDPEPSIAKYQLARSTLLQMMVQPHILHLVSYCEADHIATVEDIIDSSKLIRRAVRVFRQHENDLTPFLQHSLVRERREHLLQESRYLLRQISRLSEGKSVDIEAPLSALRSVLSQRSTLHKAIEQGYMAAPGIFHPRYKMSEEWITGFTPHGYLDCLNLYTGQPVIEKERLARLQSAPSSLKV